VAFNKAISEKFNELGGKILYEDSYQPDNENYEVILNKIQADKNIDVIFIMCFGPESANFVKRAKEKGINQQIMTYEAFHAPQVLDIAKNAANGVIFVSPSFDADSDDPRTTSLKKVLFEEYNGQREYNYFIAAHYDATALLLKAISEGNRTSQQIKAYFDTMSPFDGITGSIAFTEKGSAIVPLVVYEVRDGKFVIIKNEVL